MLLKIAEIWFLSLVQNNLSCVSGKGLIMSTKEITCKNLGFIWILFCCSTCCDEAVLLLLAISGQLGSVLRLLESIAWRILVEKYWVQVFRNLNKDNLFLSSIAYKKMFILLFYNQVSEKVFIFVKNWFTRFFITIIMMENFYIIF